MLIDIMFVNGPEDRGPIPRRAVPKSQNTVLDASLFNTQHNKVWIKCWWSNPEKKVALSPTLWCSSYWKRTSSHSRLLSANLPYIYIYIYKTFYKYVGNHIYASYVLFMSINLKKFCPVYCSSRTQPTVSLQNGKISPRNNCPGYDTKLHLMKRLQYPRFGECGVTFHCH